MFLEGANICKILAWLQGGGIFEKTRRFVILDDYVHCGVNVGDRTRKQGRSIEDLSELLLLLPTVLH